PRPTPWAGWTGPPGRRRSFDRYDYASDTLDFTLTKKTIGFDHQHKDDEHKTRDFLQAPAQIGTGQILHDADDQPAKGAADNGVEPAQDGGGEAAQPHLRDLRLQAEHQAEGQTGESSKHRRQRP